MTVLRHLQQSFWKQLINQPSDISQAIESTEEASAEQRLHIYASGYRLRLKEAISTDFERLYFYLGDQMFEQLMDAYIDQYYSHHTSLRYYSQHMTELLKTQAPFCDYPELLEIAQIEQAFNHSFDAKDCTTVSSDALASIAAEDWPNLQLQFHASLRLLNLSTNSFPVWKALSEEQTPPESIKEHTTWIVWRRDLVSRFRILEPAEAQALKLAINGASFAELCEALLDYFDQQQTPVKAVGYLQTWLSDKMICRIS